MGIWSTGYQSKDEQAAAEYLVAFIKLLMSKGKCGYEIGKTLGIHPELVEKLLKGDKARLELIAKRNKEYTDKIREGVDEKDLREVFHKQGFHYYAPNNSVTSSSYDLKGLGPWQRRTNFKNGIDYYFRHRKRYSESDIDLLTRLSTGALIEEPKNDFKDRDLLPQYKLRIINDILDGHSVKVISEKYNCSELAVKQTAEEQQVEVPASEEKVRKRAVEAIKDGYSFEQLVRRFNIREEELKELVIKHRIEPVMNREVGGAEGAK